MPLPWRALSVLTPSQILEKPRQDGEGSRGAGARGTLRVSTLVFLGATALYTETSPLFLVGPAPPSLCPLLPGQGQVSTGSVAQHGLRVIFAWC